MKSTLAHNYLSVLRRLVQVKMHAPSHGRSFVRVCIVAEMRRNTGISRGAQLQCDLFRQLGVDVELLDVSDAIRNPFLRIEHKPASTYILHSGGPQIASLLTSVLPHAANAYRIAYWAWELPVPPLKWPEPSGLVSEIWTCSEYARQSLASKFSIPIHVVPHAVPVTCAQPSFKGDRFEVLTVADSRSSIERKNPKASVQAFKQAFGDCPEARLTLKLSGTTGVFKPIFQIAGEQANIRVIDTYLQQEDMDDLVRSSSVFLSLHRAEGFGLPMLEAMAHGVPVVATRWSGNLEFMTEDNSSLVPFRLVKVDDPSVYSKYSNSEWAEPDIAEAARNLTNLYKSPDSYRNAAQAALRAALAWYEKCILTHPAQRLSRPTPQTSR